MTRWALVVVGALVLCGCPEDGDDGSAGAGDVSDGGPPVFGEPVPDAGPPAEGVDRGARTYCIDMVDCELDGLSGSIRPMWIAQCTQETTPIWNVERSKACDRMTERPCAFVDCYDGTAR